MLIRKANKCVKPKRQATDNEIERVEKIDEINAIRQIRAALHAEVYSLELSRLQLMRPGLYLPSAWSPVFLEKPEIFYKVRLYCL